MLLLRLYIKTRLTGAFLYRPIFPRKLKSKYKKPFFVQATFKASAKERLFNFKMFLQ